MFVVTSVRLQQIVFAVVLFCIFQPGRAQTSADPLRSLQDETQQHARAQKLRDPAAGPAQPQGPAALQARPADVVETSGVVMQISVADHGLLEAATIGDLLQPYRGLVIGPRRIDLLLRQLKAALVVHGRVTSTAEVEHMDWARGVLRIVLRPGTVAALAPSDKTMQGGVEQAFPVRSGDTLILQDVEQGVQQINRLRLNQAEVKIVPGTAANSHVLEIGLKKTGTAWGSVGVDNRGSADDYGTGKNRLRSSINIENPLNLFDSLALTAVQSKRSTALLAAYSLPDGYNTWSVSAAASRYRQPIPGNFTQQGESHSLGLAFNRVLLLTASDKNSIDLSLARSHSGRRFEGIDLASERLAVVRAAFLNVHKAPGLQTYGEVSLSAGMPWLGAQKDSADLQKTDAHAQFIKLAVHAGLDRRIGASRWSYSAQFDWQYAPKSLYVSEQFYLGGASSVRGYAESVVAGDRGWLLRQELRAPPQTYDQQKVVLAPYLFIDHGRAIPIHAPPAKLTGAGIGLRADWADAHFDGSLGKGFQKPATVRDYGWTLHFSISLDW